MTDGDSRILMQQHKSHGLPNDVTAADDDGALALYRNFAPLQQLENSGGRTGARRRAVCNQVSDIAGMKAVSVLAGLNRLKYAPRVNVLWERRLNEYAVHFRIPVEIFNGLEKVLGVDALGRSQIQTTD